MAIVQNKATEAGDVLEIQTDVPVVGIVSLTSFIDTTENETVSIYFEKTFRYSRDGGLTFSAWMTLNNVNVQNIIIERIDYFIIQCRYKRVGEGTPDPAFDDMTLQGDFSPLTYPVFNSMIFAQFFTVNGAEVLNWAINVLEKLYKRGIVPAYVTRNDGNSDDKDYIAYWFTVTHFFAVLVAYARQFERVNTNVTLMREFVHGRGVYMRNNPDTDELYYVFNNYIQEIQRRGTSLISILTGQTISGEPLTYYDGQAIGGDLILATADGELPRLLDMMPTDEFIFAQTTRNELGWCIGQSSPLYAGADNIINLIKGYEFGALVSALDIYPIFNEAYVALVDGHMRITGVPNGESAGLTITGLLDIAFAFVIDPQLDYEISWRVKKSVAATADLTFGALLFDGDGNAINSVKITDGSVANDFFASKALNQADHEYWIRGVLHAYDQTLIAGDLCNIGFGQGLRSTSRSCYLVPKILVVNNTGLPLLDVVEIWDIKIRPAKLPFSRGLLSARNYIIGFIKNNSPDYNNAQVERIIDEELVPYNSFTKLKFL